MTLYRFLLTLLVPVVAVWMGLRLIRGRETFGDIWQRLALEVPQRNTSKPVYWLHGASNGELTSARGLVEALASSEMAPDLIVTSNSVTGRDMVQAWNLPHVQARLAPLDYRFALRRFRKSWVPTALILLEGDLWPNRIVTSAQAGLPVAMVSARISEGSAQKWAKIRNVASAMMSEVSLLSAQDAASEARFLALGLPPASLAPIITLKSSVSLPPPDPEVFAEFQTAFPRGESFLAASTHDGEEEQVIEAYLIAKQARPDLRMILAPRHPSRGDTVAALLTAADLSFCRRSNGDFADAAVYLADTLGEMPLWYSLAGFCFVGGSLVPKGGHTPYEPAQFNCAILHGPDLRNFKDQYAALDDGGGALPITDAVHMGHTLAGITSTQHTTLTQSARRALSLDAADNSVSDLCDRLSALAAPRSD